MLKSSMRFITSYRERVDTLLGNLQTALGFDLAALTFVPGMAARATNVFAAAPIVQGAWDTTGTGDVLTYPRGNLVHDEWYANLDPYQGAVVMWITPEWNGNDGLDHFILVDSLNFYVAKAASGFLQFRFAVGSTIQVDVSAWVAGTPYCVELRWDVDYPLDGTNCG